MIRTSRLPSSMAALHNISRVCLIFTATILPIRDCENVFYYWLEVQLAYLVDFAQYLLWFAPHITFLHSKRVVHSLELLFS